MEEFTVPRTADKKARYDALIRQAARMTAREDNVIANMANLTAMLRQAFEFFWIGFYLKDSEDELVLGPFQGPVACSRIGFGKGVCGTAWKERRTVIVPDVEKFPGHIACSSLSKSEIVVPLFRGGEVFAVLDIDSDSLDTFDETDGRALKELVRVIK